MKIVGNKMQNPDPNCKECKGKGEITLFTSSCPCECINNNKKPTDIAESMREASEKIKRFGDTYVRVITGGKNE